MGLNFRRSKKFGAARFTLSKSGISASVGGKFFRVGVNSKGKVRRTISIPGTGISYTSTVGGKKRKKRRSPNTYSAKQTNISSEVVTTIVLCLMVIIFISFFYAQISMSETFGKKLIWIAIGVLVLAIGGFVLYKLKSNKTNIDEENFVSEDGWYCAVCGCKNSINNRYCRNCNAKFNGSQIKKTNSNGAIDLHDIADDNDSNWLCHNCGAKNSASSRYCNNCSTKKE